MYYLQFKIINQGVWGNSTEVFLVEALNWRVALQNFQKVKSMIRSTETSNWTQHQTSPPRYYARGPSWEARIGKVSCADPVCVSRS